MTHQLRASIALKVDLGLNIHVGWLTTTCNFNSMEARGDRSPWSWRQWSGSLSSVLEGR